MPETQPDPLARYARQMRCRPIGETGQRKLLQSQVLICGLGALGSVLANTLARAGVGRLRIVDRDFLEWNNLQRQVLYDEADVLAGLPKAAAAAEKLRRINSQIEIDAHVADVGPGNIASLVQDVDLILDGTDNFEVRFLLNDIAIQRGLPWVFGGCLGTEGQTMTIVPGETACLRCLLPEPPPTGSGETCDTAGILAPVINVIASLQATEAIKLLIGARDAISRSLTVIDVWENRIRQVQLDALREARDCRACDRHQFDWLEGRRGSHTAVLCGRNSVQLSFPDRPAVALEMLAEKLAAFGPVARNRYLVRCEVDGLVLTVFPDGRAIIGGTEDLARAKTVYAKYVGA